MLTTVGVRGYRSLRDLVLPLGQLTVVGGSNGAGKSSVYRALRLLADCGRGDVIGSLAREGGLQSARWAGTSAATGTRDRPAGLQLGYAADDVGYLVDLGLPVPSRSMFDLDPHIKREVIFAGAVMRPATTLVRRSGPLVERRTDAGDFTRLTRSLPSHRSVLSEFAEPAGSPELAAVRARLRRWRFYDGFRTDAGAPARRTQIGTRTPALSDDGADLASAVQTILEADEGAGAPDLRRAIAEAFDGATISVVDVDGLFDLHLHQPGVLRPLRSAELSDGTLRFLLWCAALLAVEPPSLMVLNEPETSLHPDLLAPLAGLILAAARTSQVVVVSHSARLTDQLAGPDTTRWELVKRDGQTAVEGQGLLDVPAWNWGSR